MAPLFLKPFIALMAIAALADVAISANYTVGEPAGSWDLTTNYEEWVKDLKFYPGDILIFQYSTPSHDVAEVTEDDYASCSSSDKLSSDDSGTTVIELTEVGTRYFICTIPTHCSNGMKVQIDVLPKSSPPPVSGTSSAPTLSPVSPPPATPAAAPPVATDKAVAQHGAGVLVYSVLGLIGLMLAVL